MQMDRQGLLNAIIVKVKDTWLGSVLSRPINSTWYQEKMLLVQAHESSQILDEEQLAFLMDLEIPDGQVVQTIIPNNAAFQTDDLDAYDSDCDDVSTTKAVRMSNQLNYSLNVLSEKDKVKQDMDENETINIKLEYSVAKLLSKNKLLRKEIKHLKKIYKDQFDSIKKTHARAKEHSDSLIAQLNSKSMENADLKCQIQEKVFVTTALQKELRRLKELLSPKLLNNREAHIDYLKTTKEQADILRGIVKQARAKQPLDNVLDFSCKHVIRIQELQVYVRDTCPSVNKSSKKLIVVTPQNKNKKVRFTEPVTLPSNTKQQVDVNVRSKSKSAKSNKKHNIWKPTGKVFTDVGYRCKPTRRTFTLDGISCPLIRITSTKVVHLKETTSKSIETQNQRLKSIAGDPN
uniref:Integrase, catalytic region, zinc finger, CCHC-type, peptidase aspartic, catalytic n=1 Tax=Tanacetum cinerariifolium TaxID=118510 RepID=A0A6L2K1R4_TANCI|nr:hypothetical protein [Tanacetum cinerariifolium]GEU43967.1 hypothetical protein [Tanacetum cinerariifolium]